MKQNMCDICRRTHCPSECPNHRGAEDERYISGEFCDECGAEVLYGEMFYEFRGGIVCKSCAEALDVEGILRFTGMKGTYALLDAVGAVRMWKG